MKANKKARMIFAVFLSAIILTLVGCQSTGQGQPQQPQKTLPFPTTIDEGELQPAQGWQEVSTFHGSGQQSYCEVTDKTSRVTKPWRVRWRVGETTNRYGNGKMTLELEDMDSKWNMDLDSNSSFIEYTSAVFTNTMERLCIFAQSNYAGYVIRVEQEAK